MHLTQYTCQHAKSRQHFVQPPVLVRLLVFTATICHHAFRMSCNDILFLFGSWPLHVALHGIPCLSRQNLPYTARICSTVGIICATLRNGDVSVANTVSVLLVKATRSILETPMHGKDWQRHTRCMHLVWPSLDQATCTIHAALRAAVCYKFCILCPQPHAAPPFCFISLCLIVQDNIPFRSANPKSRC